VFSKHSFFSSHLPQAGHSMPSALRLHIVYFPCFRLVQEEVSIKIFTTKVKKNAIHAEFQVSAEKIHSNIFIHPLYLCQFSSSSTAVTHYAHNFEPENLSSQHLVFVVVTTKHENKDILRTQKD
jgi:hypothetical protein